MARQQGPATPQNVVLLIAEGVCVRARTPSTLVVFEIKPASNRVNALFYVTP
jgi:hypothetical protein